MSLLLTDTPHTMSRTKVVMISEMVVVTARR
jgi:hypothetical protein